MQQNFNSIRKARLVDSTCRRPRHSGKPGFTSADRRFVRRREDHPASRCRIAPGARGMNSLGELVMSLLQLRRRDRFPVRNVTAATIWPRLRFRLVAPRAAPKVVPSGAIARPPSRSSGAASRNAPRIESRSRRNVPRRPWLPAEKATCQLPPSSRSVRHHVLTDNSLAYHSCKADSGERPSRGDRARGCAAANAQ